MRYPMWYELKEGNGEDAAPICGEKLLSVFDGMAGAGSLLHKTEDMGVRSSAYIGARRTREIVERFVAETYDRLMAELDANPDRQAVSRQYADALGKYIFSNLMQYAQDAGLYAGITTKGSLIKLLPTTMAGVVTRERETEVDCVFLWAGDSRCYLLGEDGLTQMTKDDLAYSVDAMDNLIEDSRMSNHIFLSLNPEAQAPGFHINAKHIVVKKPCILQCATDGVFGYVPSPMAYESLLLLTMAKSATADEWVKRLYEELSRVTNDDFSLSMELFGYADYSIVKELFRPRGYELFSTYFSDQSAAARLETLETDVREMEEKIESAGQKIEEWLTGTVLSELEGKGGKLLPLLCALEGFSDFLKDAGLVKGAPQSDGGAQALNRKRDSLPLLGNRKMTVRDGGQLEFGFARRRTNSFSGSVSEEDLEMEAYAKKLRELEAEKYGASLSSIKVVEEAAEGIAQILSAIQEKGRFFYDSEYDSLGGWIGRIQEIFENMGRYIENGKLAESYYRIKSRLPSFPEEELPAKPEPAPRDGKVEAMAGGPLGMNGRFPSFPVDAEGLEKARAELKRYWRRAQQEICDFLRQKQSGLDDGIAAVLNEQSFYTGRLKKLEQELEAAREENQRLILEQWKTYKPTYEKYL